MKNYEDTEIKDINFFVTKLTNKREIFVSFSSVCFIKINAKRV